MSELREIEIGKPKEQEQKQKQVGLRVRENSIVAAVGGAGVDVVAAVAVGLPQVQ